MKNISIIGVGLIGGSFALDLRDHIPGASISGVDQNLNHLKEALELGIIDLAGDLETVRSADLVVLALPVNASIKLLIQVLELIPTKAIVIDMGSTKKAICESVDTHPNRANFLATHPIAGTEFSGPSAAVKGLFKNKTNIICELDKTSKALSTKIIALFNKMGMRIRKMTAIDHDKHIAYVSHLSHISSFMLGKTVIDKEKNERYIFDMAGSGFESTVRLAKSSPAMWTPIFEQNKENIVETLEEYIGNLQEFKKLMEERKFDQVFKEMQQTNYISTILNGIK